MKTRINLAANKSESNKKKIFSKLNVLRYIAVGLLFCVSLSSIILFIFIDQSPLPTLQEQEKQISEALGAQQSDMAKILLVNERTKTASELLAKRQSYDVMIEKVKSKMPSGLTVTSFSVSNNNVSVTVSSKSLAALDQFIKELQDATGEDKEFARVTLSELFIDQGAYLMKIDLILI